MARTIAFAVVLSLAAGSTGIILYRYFSMRQALESSARHFVDLIGLPLAQIADLYGDVGLRDPVMSRVTGLLRLNQDLERLEIVRKNGSLAFSATRDEVKVWPPRGSAPTTEDLALFGASAARRADAERVRIDGRTVYRVVVTDGDDEQFYSTSMVAIFGYDRVLHQLRRGVFVMIVALGLALVVTDRVALALARGITSNLAVLQTGVRKIRSGQLDERVSIQSGDEIQELAEAFNQMTDNLQQTIDRLRRANMELQALDQAKVDLVANVSHELRTPLTALKGFLELLDEGELGPVGDEAHRAIVVCRRNVDRLALRVEDLVQLSQMENAWPEDLEPGPVDLKELISLVTEIYEVRIRAKEQKLLVAVGSDLPNVAGNVEQLERVILNLMDNAVKFTPTGGTISIAAEECDHEGRRGVLLRVADSGIGIPEHELVRVFDRFHQVDRSIRRRFGGMGLGLSLVHHIVESHRGVVWVESEVGSGSTFSVWLPCILKGAVRGDES
jgi:signal transduction histidine kinase